MNNSNHIILRGKKYHFRYRIPIKYYRQLAHIVKKAERENFTDNNDDSKETAALTYPPEFFAKSLHTSDLKLAQRRAAILLRDIEAALNRVDLHSDRIYDVKIDDAIVNKPKFPDLNQYDFKNPLEQSAQPVLGNFPQVKKFLQPIFIDEIVHKYCDYQVHVKAAWRPATEKDNKAIYALLIRIFGKIDCNMLTHEEAIRIQKIILKLPPNINKRKEFRDVNVVDGRKIYTAKSINEIIEMGYPPINRQTAEKYFIRLSSLLKYAVHTDLIAKNSFEGLSLGKENAKRDENKRHPFELGELYQLFHDRRFIHDMYKFDHEWQYYCLPTLLLSGMRISEWSGLTTGCITYQRDSIMCFDLKPNKYRKLKNKSAERLIPVHSFLRKKMKFDEYYNRRLREVLSLREQGKNEPGDDLLFNLPFDKTTGTNYRCVTEWFNGYTDRNKVRHKGFKENLLSAGDKVTFIKIPEKTKKDLHSLRSNTLQMLKTQLDIPTHLTRFLMGHHQKEMDMSFMVYSGDWDVAQLKIAIERIIYPIQMDDIRPYTEPKL